MASSHLLQHANEESNLDMSGLLQERVESGGSLGLTKDTEPLFNGGQLVFELLIEGGGSHVFEGVFVLIDIGNPLLRGIVHVLVVSDKGLALWSRVEVDL